jgi:NAD(P)-dependent dehydrogenase (short-subunit alcohol dehydrogenase family)
MVRTALVTGGNRGIGLEACRQLAAAGLEVVLTARDAVKGVDAVDTLQHEGLAVVFERLDVGDPGSVRACAERLEDAGRSVDVLVNNAAVNAPDGVFALAEDTLRGVMDVNLYGPLRTCQAFVPAMVRRGYGRVVNVSSGSGSISAGIPGPAAYSISKAALNALTRVVAAALGARGDVKVNAMCPGWVRTDMGGSHAPRGVEEAVDTLVWLATLPVDGPTNGFFRDRRPIDW